MLTTTLLHLWLLLILIVPLAAFAAGVQSFTTTVKANGKSFPVTGVKVNLRDPAVSVKVGLAWDAVGRTEALAGIATRTGAVAAINGSFFNAYTKDALKNPDMSLITDGRLVFKSNIGCVLGFTADKTPVMDGTRYKLGGTITPARGGSPLAWHAYWINRKPTATPCVTIFTRQWGKTVEAMSGTSVVVRNGVVSALTTGAATIPEDGYIIHIRGEEKLLARFHVGDRITSSPQMTSGDAQAWAQVREAVGAGPQVLADSVPVFDPKAAGFSDPKILSNAGARSAVGYNDDGMLYLITVPSARVAELGQILKALGCTNGMNLDGGASSGLWYRGNYLTSPGRAISNALVILER